jgi:hypothetical protein
MKNAGLFSGPDAGRPGNGRRLPFFAVAWLYYNYKDFGDTGSTDNDAGIKFFQVTLFRR